MTTGRRWGACVGASVWDADAGPPRCERLSRAQRVSADLSARILAHVLEPLASCGVGPLSELPWVLGRADATGCLPPSELVVSGMLPPAAGVSVVAAGAATVAMTLLEALGQLEDHPAVLVVFVQGAVAPLQEAMASALVLARTPLAKTSLVLATPALRRAGSRRRPGSRRELPLASSARLVRAIYVGRPTIETVPASADERPEYWQIEVRTAF